MKPESRAEVTSSQTSTSGSAAGEFVPVAVREGGGQADVFEEFQDARRGLAAAGAPVQAQGAPERLTHSAAGVERALRVLRDELEAAALLAGAAVGGGGQPYAVEGDTLGIWLGLLTGPATTAVLLLRRYSSSSAARSGTRSAVVPA
ncbi:hypothetical protein GCM10009730_36540 [Streptomyces albidochromogenes]|uniref:hypothetical protein n=1 Tax=Streptomyces albidochromogenes TaxID=329524 RepID=UPI001ABFA70A